MSRRIAVGGLAHVIVVTALLVSASCSSPAERLPGPTSLSRFGSTPPPSNIDRIEWTLNKTLRAVSGPDNCFSRQLRARIDEVLQVILLVERSGTSLRLVYDLSNFPTDSLEYRTTIEARRFAAVTDIDVSYPPCEGLSLNGKFVSRVSGAFSESGSGLTAVEEVTFSFSWGQMSLRYDWLAGQP